MNVLCLDLEGVLIPEVWLAVAEKTGIEALTKTTRDIPVYDELMQMRLGVLAENDLPLSMIQQVIDGLDPLPGAAEFMAWARVGEEDRRFRKTLAVSILAGLVLDPDDARALSDAAAVMVLRDGGDGLAGGDGAPAASPTSKPAAPADV